MQQASHRLWGSVGLKMPIHTTFWGRRFWPTK